MIPHLYIFSGLGADERMFRNLDLTGFQYTHIRWDSPFKGESLEGYSRRISKQIVHDLPVLLGLSFGGIVAIEVSKWVQVAGIVIISSAKTNNEIPYYYRLLGKARIHQLIPVQYLRNAGWLAKLIFGAKSKSDAILLETVLKETDSKFFKWAIHQIVNWKNSLLPKRMIHIHGTRDFILPMRYVKADHAIQGGTHLMILNKQKQIREILEGFINSIPGSLPMQSSDESTAG